MVNGIDRLERFFSKKKHAASRSSAGVDRPSSTVPVPSTPAAAAASAAPQPARTESRFPPPSFLRPKANRMLPRDDSSANSRPSTAGRGQARPDTAMTAVECDRMGTFSPYGRLSSIDSSFAPTASCTTIVVCGDDGVCTASYDPSVPQRPASLRERRKASIATLRDIQPTLVRLSAAMTSSSGEISPTTTFQSASPPQLKLQLGEFQDLRPFFLQSPSMTPPPSDLDEKVYMDEPLKTSPAIRRVPVATRPEREDLTDRPLLQRDSVVSVVLAQDPVRDDGGKLSPSSPPSPPSSPPPPAIRRKSRMAHRPGFLRINRQLPVERAPLSADSVLKEPNLGDFLSLSDEDIAETEPAAAAPAATAAANKADAAKETPAKAGHQVVSPASAPVGPRTPPSVSPAFVSTAAVLRSRKFSREAPPSKPPSCQAPPLPLPLPVPTMFLGDRAVSPKSPGRPQTPASQLRMSAAFEIARIASQYKFDMAYIATIWPKNMAIQKTAMTATAGRQPPFPASPASPTSSFGPAMRISRTNSQASRMSSYSACSSIRTTGSNDTVRSTATASLSSHGSPAPMGPQSKLEAQFLAAYGLATVKAPYSLSAPTHARMLNAERWLRFSEPNAQVDEFSMGYGCAFYRGHVPVKKLNVRKGSFFRRPSIEDCDADTEQDDREDQPSLDNSGRTTPRPAQRGSSSSSSSSSSSGSGAPNNRGIVFVAYRRKAEGEETDAARNGGSSNDSDDLNALYRDVEKLVGRILDFHMMQQRQGQLEMLRAVPGPVDDVLAAAASGMEMAQN